ncbi:unnamed protein product [Parnassius mnemosyne]|uniref:Reverse transcriptase domain-containing protein n=1 Tax=Parnassius mnemosyne TaxID=213953 RepID=A0AAV1K8Q9_9NEOP
MTEINQEIQTLLKTKYDVVQLKQRLENSEDSMREFEQSFQQHGFVNGRSTTTNLILCSDYLSEHMSEPSQVDVVYTDYSKCFDRIDHLLLLHKIQSSSRVCLSSMESYL